MKLEFENSNYPFDITIIRQSRMNSFPINKNLRIIRSRGKTLQQPAPAVPRFNQSRTPKVVSHILDYLWRNFPGSADNREKVTSMCTCQLCRGNSTDQDQLASQNRQSFPTLDPPHYTDTSSDPRNRALRSRPRSLLLVDRSKC